MIMSLDQKLTVHRILDAARRKNYRVFKNQRYDYNLNIWGIRHSTRSSGLFDDRFIVFWVYGNKWHYFIFPGTTDPSRHYLLNPMNSRGTAIMLPQQSLGAYKLCGPGRSDDNIFGCKGHGRESYRALRQVKKLWFVRDNNLDTTLDIEDNLNKEFAIINANIHRASKWKILERIGLYSAGCQVIQKNKDFNTFIELCMNSYYSWKTPYFSYTLLHEEDL